MIKLPPLLDGSRLRALAGEGGAVVIGRPQAIAALPGLAGMMRIDSLDQARARLALVVVGGGMRIDQAKAWRAHNSPQTELIAIATRYGSGAEANGIAVLDQQGRKTIEIGDAFCPDGRFYDAQSLETLGPQELMFSAGDAMTHAVEGLLSPMASPGLRQDLAGVIRRMLDLPSERDARWFELSALASAGQAQASVGLVHGLAHELEAPAIALLGHDNRNGIGHARLCAAFLAPVLRYNLQSSDKAAAHFANHDLDVDEILRFADRLAEAALGSDLPWAELIRSHWRDILRNPCTRTNVATVRPAKLDQVLALLPGAGGA